MSKGTLLTDRDVYAREAGAVLNKNNRTAVSAAMAILRSVLKAAGLSDDDNEDNSDEGDKSGDKKTKPAATDDKTKPAAKPASDAAKEAAANLIAIEAGGFSVSDLATLLQNALNATREPTRDSEYAPPLRIVDIFDSYMVYCVGWSGTEYYQIDYSVTKDGTVTLGTPAYVNRKVTYIAPAVSDTTASEAGAFVIADEFTRLAEAAVTGDGKTLIKLIAPGLGSSGLYTSDVLQRDGPRAFPKGTKMFWDHDTAAEEASKPEGTLSRFAAVLDEDARWIADHKAGAGLYAPATVFENYRDEVNEMAAFIGTSIRADGSRRMGEYNGARVPIITELKPSNGINNRVDFVTVPGAGGKVLALFESARNRPIVPETDERTNEMALTDEQIKEAISAGIKAATAPLVAQVARLSEAATIQNASQFADRVLSGPKYSTLPPATRQRIAANVATSATLTESGAIDATALTAAIEAAAKDEAAYLSSATGRTIAIGLGESRATGDGAGDDKAFEEELNGAFERWGHSKESAQAAARGRLTA